MNVVFLQMLTVGAIGMLTIIEYVSVSWKSEALGKDKERLWYVRARRIGVARLNIHRIFYRNRMLESVFLEKESYLVGNRMRNDLYVDASGKEVRLFVNVQKEKIYLTVLEGFAMISGWNYEADKTRRIEIDDRTRVTLSDIELEFVRKRGI